MVKIKSYLWRNPYFIVTFVLILLVLSFFTFIYFQNDPIEKVGEVQTATKINFQKKESKIKNPYKYKKTNTSAFKASIKSAKASDIVFGITQNTIAASSRGRKNNSTKNLGWIPYWNQAAGFSSLKQNAGFFDYVGLFWYLIRKDGAVEKYPFAVENSEIINFAHSKNIKVLAVIANLPAEDEGGSWDPNRVNKVISDSTLRKQHIADLVILTIKNNFDGINIDYEALPASQKENFTVFIKELSTSLHKKGKILGVSLHPKISEGDPEYSNGSEAQDWAKLSRYADHLYLMTYEEHWETSPPGPLASIPWLTTVLNYAKELIPEDKLFAGVPLDGYDWGESKKAKGVTYKDVVALISKYKPNISWDQKSKTHYFGYRDGNISHKVWFEDIDSFKEKLKLFDSLGIPNLSFWPLGNEDKRIWQSND